MSLPRRQFLRLTAVAAAGYSGLDGDGWVGALVPAGTPKDIAGNIEAPH